MKFGYTIIYVDDVVKTLEFYEKAFGLKRRYLHDNNKYGEVDTDGTTLSFASECLEQENPIDVKTHKKGMPHTFELALVTEDVDGAFKKAVAAGAKAISKPAARSWGQTIACVSDNNGVMVELCSPMG